jgi:SPP1 family predicted phage head-tail adaptor
MLPAGQMRNRIVVQRPATGKDTEGNVQRDWLDVEKLWSKREDLSGRELEAAQSLHAEITTRFTIRFRADFDATMRIVYQDQIYGIQAILDRTGLRNELQLLCSTGLNNG